MTKTPQDHKTTKAARDAQQQISFQEVEGHELLKPFSELTGADGARIIGRLKSALGTDPADMEEGAAAEDMDFDAMADLIDFIGERYVVDPAGWAEFNTAANVSKVLELVSAFAGELGKGAA